MGDTFGDGRIDEKPVHKVKVDSFYICKYEVTKRQWTELMGGRQTLEFYRMMAGPEGNYPMISISWLQAEEFVQKLNKKTGKHFRLPTEAEWEYAAREMGKKTKWSGTSSSDDLYQYAVIRGTGSRQDIGIDGIDPIGSKKPNALGIYDMTGNVWEWTSDWYLTNYYDQRVWDNPQGPPDLDVPYYQKLKSIRGGSYNDRPQTARVTQRMGVEPFSFGGNIGFRLVHPVE